jgi:hypothetical protein
MGVDVMDELIAAWPSLKTDLRNAGAEWVDQEAEWSSTATS